MNRRRLLATTALAATGLAVPARADAAPRISPTPVAGFPTVDNKVLALRVLDGWVWVGGTFTTPARNLFAFQPSTGKLVAINAPGPVWSITSTGNTIYYGGYGYVRAVNASTHKPVACPIVPPRNRVVKALSAYAGAVVVGAGDTVTRWDGGRRTWSKTVGNVGAGGAWVKVLRWAGAGSWYAGGFFTSYDGHTRQGIARISATTGKLIPAFNPVLRANSGRPIWQGFEDGDNVLSMAAMPAGQLALGVGGQWNGLVIVNATTGKVLHRRWTVGDCQATTAFADRVVTGNHTNNGYVTHTGTRRMAYAWSLAGVKEPWDAGFSQTGYWAELDPSTGLKGAYPEFQADGVNDLVYEPASRLLIAGGAFTGWGNHDGTAYGVSDPHPRRGLAAFKVGV